MDGMKLNLDLSGVLQGQPGSTQPQAEKKSLNLSLEEAKICIAALTALVEVSAPMELIASTAGLICSGFRTAKPQDAAQFQKMAAEDAETAFRSHLASMILTKLTKGSLFIYPDQNNGQAPGQNPV